MKNETFLFDSESLTKEDRLCFVKDHENQLWFDINEKAPVDKVVYLPCEQALLVEALDKKLIEEALEAQAKGTMALDVAMALRKKFLESLSLAKKSGITVLGLEKVKEHYHKGSISNVFLASDAGADVTKRVDSWEVGSCTALDKDTLSKALGGENVSLVGLLNKPQIESLLLAWQRYESFSIENKME